MLNLFIFHLHITFLLGFFSKMLDDYSLIDGLPACMAFNVSLIQTCSFPQRCNFFSFISLTSVFSF